MSFISLESTLRTKESALNQELRILCGHLFCYIMDSLLKTKIQTEKFVGVPVCKGTQAIVSL